MDLTYKAYFLWTIITGTEAKENPIFNEKVGSMYLFESDISIQSEAKTKWKDAQAEIEIKLMKWIISPIENAHLW
jgi:hypothetical protein